MTKQWEKLLHYSYIGNLLSLEVSRYLVSKRGLGEKRWIHHGKPCAKIPLVKS